MLENEIKDIWKNAGPSGQLKIDTKTLSEELTAKINAVQKDISRRDTREISAAIFGILLFGYLLFEIPFPLTKIACGLAIGWFVFVVVKFRKSKLSTSLSDFSLPLAEQLDQQQSRMIQQAALLNSALYWYAIPPFLMNVIFILGLANPADYEWTNRVAVTFLPLTSNFKIITLIGLALFYALIYWLNKNALAKEIKPMIARIEKMKQQITTN